MAMPHEQILPDGFLSLPEAIDREIADNISGQERI